MCAYIERLVRFAELIRLRRNIRAFAYQERMTYLPEEFNGWVCPDHVPTEPILGTFRHFIGLSHYHRHSSKPLIP